MNFTLYVLSFIFLNSISYAFNSQTLYFTKPTPRTFVQPTIYNGEDDDQDKFQLDGSVVQLEITYQYENSEEIVLKKEGHCSGVVISKTHVLTAGHCVQMIYKNRIYKALNIKVLLNKGYQQSRRSMKKYDVPEKSKILPMDQKVSFVDVGNDIAVITLDRQIPEGIRVFDVDEAQNPKDKSSLLAAGYGSLSPQGGDNDQMHYVVFQSVTPQFYDGYMLFDQKDRGTCSGDSGGPIFILETNSSGASTLRLSGISSAGKNVCGGEGAFVLVESHVSFIKRILSGPKTIVI